MSEALLLMSLLLLQPLTVALSPAAIRSTVPSATELRTFLLATTQKIPGSISHDPSATSELEFQLGLAADYGEMPSFADPGSRAGYALDFFCRAMLTADLLWYTQEESPAFFVERIRDLLFSSPAEGRKICRLSSIGGGPGYDFVAAALVSSFHAAGACNRATTVEATIFDYEEGWCDLVDAMSLATRGALLQENGGEAEHSCYFGGKCDITRPLSDPSNAGCRTAAATTDLWICQYCVAENAGKLRDGQYVFFKDLFREAKEGSLFVFTETTHRLWPEFADVALQVADARENGFEIAFPRVAGRGKGGWQMVLQKKRGAVVSEEQLALCDMFRLDREMHERKVQRGWSRQTKKIRGGK